MKNKVGLIMSIVLIIAGAVLSYFAKFTLAQMSGFAVTMFGAGLACATMWKDRSKEAKTWLVVLSMVLTGIGAFLAGLMGVITESQVTTIIGLVFSMIILVAGIVTSVIANKAVKSLN